MTGAEPRRLGPVAHVVPDLHKEASGVAPAVIDLAGALIAQGLDISLHTLEPTPRPLPGLEPRVSLHIYRRARIAWRLGWSGDMRRSLRDVCRRAAIVHVHSLWMMPNIYPASACRGQENKLVVSPHGTLTDWSLKRSRLRKRFAWYVLGQRRLLERAALFHATSEAEAESIRAFGYRAPITLIPNGVRVLETASTGPRPNDPRTLLFLSRIHPVKGLDLLLRAWQRLQHRYTHWRLHVVGPDNEGYLASMKALAADLDLKRVRFRGPLFGADKYHAYSAADVYVLPSWSENFAYTVAESLACGTPVVTTRQTPWRMLDEARCGWWIDTGVEPLVACLDEVMSTPREELEQRGMAGRAWVRRELAWPVIGRKMAASYRWLAGQGDKPDWILD